MAEEDGPAPTRHEAILRSLGVLGEAHLDHPVLQRAVGSKFLPQRLRERWQALGIGNDQARNASAAEDSAETRKRLRMEAMRQRQQALMRRMQQQQSQAVAAMEAGQGALDEENEVEDSDALWQCATCREAGTPENPLAMLAAVVPWQAKSSSRGALPGYARFTSCRHLVHVGCGEAHAQDVRNQAGRSHFFFVDAAGGEFPCPMCRSVANCLLPCIPDKEFLSSDSQASWQPEAAQVAPSRLRPPPESLRSALQRCARRALRAEATQAPAENGDDETVDAGALSIPLLRGAAAELRAAAALFPLQLMDEGPPAPLYAVLLRSAALLRSKAPAEVPKLEEPGWQSKVLAWLAQPRSPWLADLKVKDTFSPVLELSYPGAFSLDKKYTGPADVPCKHSIIVLGEEAQAVQVQGDEQTPCKVVFFAVDPSMLQLDSIGCERFSSTPDVMKAIAAFQETCDACFAPALRCEVPQRILELRLSPVSRRFLWNSVVIVPDFLSREECHIFMDAADRAAAVGTSAGNFYAYQGNMNRYPLRKLDLEAQMLSSSVFKERLVPLLECELPDVVEELFGRSERLSELQPFFSPGEPAVNRYMTGGGIAPHIDREAMTLNVVLSEPGAFTGGGTAFWSQVDGEKGEAGNLPRKLLPWHDVSCFRV
ncbi:HEX1 [Symbiodinium natans]|uniref:E3 ubiquitin-protein ligase n=1 Tax=Symbiodinium natans TaxID=878477 RepID=A0A812K5K7_9DINO|nr:HEX1 [Symbiodinium natans]